MFVEADRSRIAAKLQSRIAKRFSLFNFEGTLTCLPMGRRSASAVQIPFFGRLIEDLSEIFNELSKAQPCILKTEHRNDQNYESCAVERLYGEKATVKELRVVESTNKLG